jgi:hypothetical protein
VGIIKNANGQYKEAILAADDLFLLPQQMFTHLIPLSSAKPYRSPGILQLPFSCARPFAGCLLILLTGLVLLVFFALLLVRTGN